MSNNRNLVVAIVTFFSIVIIAFNIAAPKQKKLLEITVSEPTLKLLFYAIRQRESSHNDRAVGDNGKSRGPYQITKAYWADANVEWDYDTFVWSRFHSEQVMIAYWKRYGAQTDEQRARMHNGGPRGVQKASTLNYWKSILQILEQNRKA